MANPSSKPNDARPTADLQKVLAITQAMAATGDLDDLLKLIIDESLSLLRVERATLFLYERQSNELVARIATGMKELRVPAEKGFCGEVIRTGETLVIPDAYADARFNPQVDRQSGFRTRNIMSVPLRDYEGQLVGVLQLLNKTDGDFSSYDISLAETLGAQAGVAIQRARLMEHFLQKQKMERAMQIARDIQQGLLPTGAPAVEGFDIAGRSIPADETGGDSFDYLPLPENHWGIVVADATGHGIGPALVIAETRSMFRARAAGQSLPVSDLLATANQLLCDDLGDGRFVTCFLGMLDPDNNSMTWASAGHGPIFYYHRHDDRFEEISATSLPLGVMDVADYDEVKTFDFQPGDFAVITTDGIFEAADPSGEQFGTQRMMEQLRQDRDSPAKTMLENLLAAVDAFSGDEPQADDITGVVVKAGR